MNIWEVQDVQVLDNVDSVFYKLGFFIAIFLDSALAYIDDFFWNRNGDG